MVKEKEKLALSINHCWVESIFSPNPVEYFTPFFFIELPSFYGISFYVYKDNSLNSNHMHD
jgi:hypothetical protein